MLVIELITSISIVDKVKASRKFEPNQVSPCSL